jgi:hypothetical protein
MVPSQAVSTITRLFPDAVTGGPGNFPLNTMAAIKSVLAIIDKIPEDLLVLRENDYADFVVAVSELQVISEWLIAKGTPAGGMQPAWNYGAGANPIERILNALNQCPDEYPPPGTKTLLFVDDEALRDSIRSDAGAVERAIKNNEWKAATVFSGSAIEALLFWKVSKHPKPDIDAGVDDLERLQKFSVVGGRPNNQIERWNLGQLIVVAEKFGWISSTTASAAHLARDFRNLIHPAKSVRTGAVSNKATAYSAAGAMEHVVEDLSR